MTINWVNDPTGSHLFSAELGRMAIGKCTFAVILAAGRSRRMGRCKATLAWQQQTLLTYQIEQFVQVQVQPIVVLGPHNNHLVDHRLAVSYVINPDPAQGKISSLRVGLAQVPEPCSTIILSAVDQPRTANLYGQLLEKHTHSEALITLPTHQGRKGHPVVVSSCLRPQLNTLSEATQGLRHFLQTFQSELHLIEWSAEALLDLNTPQEYKAANRICQAWAPDDLA